MRPGGTRNGGVFTDFWISTENQAATMNADGVYPYSQHRSSIQVAPLQFNGETLTAERDKPFDFFLPNME